MTNQAQNIAIRGFLQLRQSPVFVLAVILFFIFRPEEGYIRRLEFIKFLIDNGHFFRNIFIYEITSLLPLLVIVPLIFYRKRVGAAIKGFMDSQMSKAVIEEFDKDGDDKLSKEEFQGFFEKASEDIEEEKKDFDSDALFDKHDSNKDGKLDGDEISSLILELFHVVRNEVTPSSGDEPVKVDSGKDEIQKLDRLYNEGYLSKERYERLKQDLSR
tara:strand:+ start:152 stop:796 length:645 start_codon:yes stop_codon:yes gene_type:complete